MANIVKDISAAAVVWDYLGTPITFTPTFGSVTVEWTQETVPVKQDGFGTTAIDLVSSGGENPKVTAALSAMDSTRLAQIFGVTLDTNEHIVKCDVGTVMGDTAKPMVIKPLVNGTASVTKAEWTKVYKATKPRFELSHVYDDETQRVWNVVFTALPATASGDERKLISFGVNA